MRCSTPRVLDDRYADRFRIGAVIALAIEHIAHGENGLERIALSTAGRRHIGFAARNPDRIVEDRLDGFGIDAAAVILDRDRFRFHGDRDHRSDFGFLAASSSALSINSLSMTSGQSWTECPVWFCSSRWVQNSISRETRKATRVNFGGGFALDFGFATICKN